MAASPVCPKCAQPMQVGVVLDNTYGARGVSTWLEGAPERSIWVGVKLMGRRPIEIKSYRCISCGYLENYAKP